MKFFLNINTKFYKINVQVLLNMNKIFNIDAIKFILMHKYYKKFKSNIEYTY